MPRCNPLGVAKVLPADPIGDDEVRSGWNQEHREVLVVRVAGNNIDNLRRA